MKTRILILSCNTGGGHNAAGRAVREVFEAHGCEALFPDYLSLAGEKVSRLVSDTYIETARRSPRLFGQAYRLGMAVSRHSTLSPIYYANHLMAGYLRDYLKANPVDAIVMPHLYPAETLTYMKRSGEALPLTFAIATDYTCIPFWEETDCDFYVLPAPDLVGEFVERGMPERKLLPLGIPVSSAYSQPLSRQEARRRLDLPEEGRCILIMGGSMGAGSLYELTHRLLEQTAEERLVVIAGSNEKTAEHLRGLSEAQPRLRVLRYTQEVPLYLRACDLLFTKPGGLTSTEAAVSGIPLVHTDPIPGCETQNSLYFSERGMSRTAPSVEGQVTCGLSLLRCPEACEAMRACQRQGVPEGAAERIYQRICQEIEGRAAGR